MSTNSNIAGITLDYAKIPTYNGSLFPVRLKFFLYRVDQYFSVNAGHDFVKINLISNNFTDKALLWYKPLISFLHIYENLLFCNHIWPNGWQHCIQNELYCLCSHNNFSTMQEHAMQWIDCARYVSPGRSEGQSSSNSLTFPVKYPMRLEIFESRP